jgi:hypothetical protein
MALSFSDALRNARANAITAAVDAGSGAGILEIRTGAKPASPDDAATGTLLASITLADPSFGAAVDGVITLDNTPELSDASADATGTAAHFRIKTSAGTGVIDGTVTATGGGGDLTLNTVSLVAAATFTITGTNTITEA